MNDKPTILYRPVGPKELELIARAGLTNDRRWAGGGDGSGKNRLGQLLMELRNELRRAGIH
jgi:predicted NAD-dependent protein-ADP-ribosyltransferase YbiA (DUF1768 family)